MVGIMEPPLYPLNSTFNLYTKCLYLYLPHQKHDHLATCLTHVRHMHSVNDMSYMTLTDQWYINTFWFET